jgi:hypothetical protein
VFQVAPQCRACKPAGYQRKSARDLLPHSDGDIWFNCTCVSILPMAYLLVYIPGKTSHMQRPGTRSDCGPSEYTLAGPCN